MGMCDTPEMVAVCAANPALAAPAIIGGVAGEAAASAGNAFLNSTAQAMREAYAWVVKTMVTWWVDFPTPGLTGSSGTVAEIQRHLSFYMLAAAMFGMIIAAGRLALARDGETPLRDLTKDIAKWILISAGGTAGISAVTIAGDQFASWIITRATGPDFAAAMDQFTGVGLFGPLGSMLMLILCLFGVFAGMAQIFMSFARSACLVLLAGALPFSAAAAIGGGTAREGRDKLLAWVFAFGAWKPTAGVCFAGSFWSVSKGDFVVGPFLGVFMLIISVLALPALMRLITPVVASISGGSSAGAAAGGAVGAAAATGARLLSSRGGRGSGGGGRAARFNGGGTSAGAAGGGAAGSAGGGRGAGLISGSGGKAAAAGAAKMGAAAGSAATGGVLAAAAIAQKGVQAARSGAQTATTSPGQDKGAPSGARSRRS
ncbi:hypothetical protein [Saccharopolyspora pogona]|uniref:hypothetical protein n=1 Tax=Saccharopolyspora pogona TaxID=333966 RepID=UPI0016892DF1|nr:hypothetical protein [Saccharopolyspora pogona]